MNTTPTIWQNATKVNTTDGGTQQINGQIVALKDGGYAVVWMDDSRAFNSSGFTILGQRYDALGNKVGNEKHLGFSSNQQFDPSVTALTDGNIAVAFTIDTSASDSIFVKVFSSALDNVRTDFVATGSVSGPAITAVAGGGYVVGYNIGGTHPQLVANSVSSFGVVGQQFGVHAQIDNSYGLELATLANGNVVASFVDANTGNVGTSYWPSFRILTADGQPVTDPIVVPGATGMATTADVAALAFGGFVVVHKGSDGSLGGIRASVYNDAGQVVSAILVNTGTLGDQILPNVVASQDGGFVVTWDDGHSQHARAQRFDAVGGKAGTEFVVSTSAGTAWAEAALLADGRLAYAFQDSSSGDANIWTSIHEPRSSVINGTDGADVITTPHNLTATVNGFGGHDTIYGVGSGGTLNGGAGNDTFIPSTGGEWTIVGGTGIDTLDYSRTHDVHTAITVNMVTGTVLRQGGSRVDTISEVEIIHGTAFNDSFLGAGGDDLFFGNAGTDVLDGGTGADTLDGGTGDDWLIGSTGNDVYVVGQAGDRVMENANEGFDTVRSTISFALQGSLEALELQGTANLIGWGNAGNNTLYGNIGNNNLYGDAGHDTLAGFDGNDYLDGATGGDALYGGNGNDIVHAGDGDDLLNGGTGDDWLIGAAGNDTYVIDSAGDRVAESANEGFDTVRSSINFALQSNLEALELQGSADLIGWGNGNSDGLYGNSGINNLYGDAGYDTLVGFDGNDYLDGATGGDALYGGNGNDTLHAGDGDDLLNGGAGDDRLFGATGNDVFVFNGAYGNDTIHDFAAGAGIGDVIQLDDAHFANFSALLTATNDDGLGNSVIAHASGSITLTGVLKAQLNIDDFQFV